MSGGVRPKGSKSYAATRSPEAAEAYRQDQTAQKTLDADDKKLCPKCGMELPLEEGWDSMVYHCKPCHIVIDAETGEACEIRVLERLYPPPGRKEKVKL